MRHTGCPSWVSEASLLSDIPMEDTLAGGYLNRKVVSKSTFYFFTAKRLRSPVQHQRNWFHSCQLLLKWQRQSQPSINSTTGIEWSWEAEILIPLFCCDLGQKVKALPSSMSKRFKLDSIHSPCQLRNSAVQCVSLLAFIRYPQHKSFTPSM